MKFILILLIILIASMGGGCLEDKLSTYSISTPVLVTFDNQNNPDGHPGNYYIITAQITGTDTKYTLTMPAGTVIGGKTTEDEIEIEISGINTEWTAALEDDPSPITYTYAHLMDPAWLQQEELRQKEVPYYILGTNKKLISAADIKLILPDGSTQQKRISSYGTDTVITFPVRDSNGVSRTVYFKMQSVQLASGDLPPSGDLAVVQKPFTGHRLVTFDNLKGGVSAWNNYAFDEFHYTPGDWFSMHYSLDSWSDAFTWMDENHKIPDRMPETASSINIVTATDSQVTVTYPTTVFAPLMTAYIPEEIAGEVTVNEQTPEFKFNSISKISSVESGSYRLKVTGTAVRSGTIRLSVDGPAIKAAGWVDGPEKQIIAGTGYIFYTDLEFNDVLDADTTYECTIYSMPAGLGTPTSKNFDVYLADKDTTTSHALRVYAITDTTGDKVASAPLYVGYGADRQVGYEDSTVTVTAGTYQVYSENVTGWYAAYTAEHPRTVEVDKDKSVEILFTQEPPKHDDSISIVWWLPVGVVIILFGLFYVNMGGPGAGQIKQFSQPVLKILSYPQFWIFLAILLVTIVAWMIYQDASGKIDDLTNAIKEFKVI